MTTTHFSRAPVPETRKEKEKKNAKDEMKKFYYFNLRSGGKVIFPRCRRKVAKKY
jgi:hypothetical protein